MTSLYYKCLYTRDQLVYRPVRPFLTEEEPFLINIHGSKGSKGLIARVFSKFSKNCPKAICRTVRVKVKLIFNCTRTFSITCLSPVEHRGHDVTDQ